MGWLTNILSPHIHPLLQESTRIHMEVLVAKNLYRRLVQRTRFVRYTMRKLVSWKRTQIGKTLTKTLWKNFWLVQLSPCSFPQMRSGLANFLTKLSFKEDRSVSEEQQNLLLLNSKWTIWMVCNLRGMESPLKLKLGIFSERPRKGREAFASKNGTVLWKTPKTLMKWPGLMPPRYWISCCENSIFWKFRGGAFATSHVKLNQRAISTLYAR